MLQKFYEDVILRLKDVLVHLLKCTGPIKRSVAHFATVDSRAGSRRACRSTWWGLGLIPVGIVSVPVVVRVVHGWRRGAMLWSKDGCWMKVTSQT
jgi:hypothetical protein